MSSFHTAEMALPRDAGLRLSQRHSVRSFKGPRPKSVVIGVGSNHTATEYETVFSTKNTKGSAANYAPNEAPVATETRCIRASKTEAPASASSRPG